MILGGGEIRIIHANVEKVKFDTLAQIAGLQEASLEPIDPDKLMAEHGAITINDQSVNYTSPDSNYFETLIGLRSSY